MIDSHLDFEPKLRVKASGYGGSGYAIPQPGKAKPLRLPGVTTVLNNLPKDAVNQWAVDNTVAYMIANLDRVLDLEDDVIFQKYRWYWKRQPKVDDPEVSPNNYHVGVLHDAAETGTLVHDWIAAHVLGLFEPEIQKIEQEQAITAFLNWERDHDIELLFVEHTVVNETLGYAGTLDHIWKLDGEISLVDTKTSRGIYDSHVAQLAALNHAEYMMIETGNPEHMKYRTKQWGDTYWEIGQIPEYSRVGILKCRFDDFDKDGNDVPAVCEFTELPQEQLDIGWDLFVASHQMATARRDWKKIA